MSSVAIGLVDVESLLGGATADDARRALLAEDLSEELVGIISSSPGL